MSVTKLVIHIDNLPSVMALYDRIQVWRSPDKSGSPTAYAEITADEAEEAQVNGTVAGPWALNGQSLVIALDNSDPYTVTFTGTLGLAAVLARINSFKAGVAAETGVDTNKVSISSPTTGSGSSVLLSGSAAATLGLSTSEVNGKEARLAFGLKTEDYTFYDLDGDEDYWYKVRYYASGTGAVSAYSPPHEGIPETVTSGDTRVLATANLMDGAGRPIVGRRFIFVPTSQVSATGTDGNPFVSLPSVDRIEAETDESGHMEISLLIGQTFRVFVEGSSFHRELVVPDEDFDVFEALSTTNDAFNIVVVPPMPIRVS